MHVLVRGARLHDTEGGVADGLGLAKQSGRAYRADPDAPARLLT